MVASAGKIVTDFGFPRRIAGRLLHDKPFCAQEVPNSEHVPEKRFTRSNAMNSCRFRRSLTWRSADGDVAGGTIEQGSDVVMQRYSGEAPADLGLAPRIDLAEESRLDPGALEPDRVAADAGKEVERFHVDDGCSRDR